ncbi:MAG: UDP-N-acetylglucosamine 2-epimerase (non-hydrolyzing) [Candidatus Diapherotrites archaeon]|nr:UDP-N-acetylglucosamine 2-epimerase (non-hydrolyzing) [Candidatus Diapherotrites archaeon]
MKKIAIVFGTRPEIIKLAEIIKLLKADKAVKTLLVFTGQHYDYNLFEVFMKELELPNPDINLGIGSGTQAYQVGTVLMKLEEFFSKQKPDIVIALGDTNSVFGAALAAEKMKIPFAHVEAGIRSFDRTMAEEVNRVLADQISSYCFAPTQTAVENLHNSEAFKHNIILTGNPIVEVVQKNLERAKNSKIIEKLGLEPEKFGVLTMHRAENVDSREKLENMLDALKSIETTIVFPAHPRTLSRIKKFGMQEKFDSIKNLRIVEALGYFDFLHLCANSRYILSDSGGIQEEASVYKKFVVVLRENTERPEILEKFAVLTGFDEQKITGAIKKIERNFDSLQADLAKIDSPFGDGNASKRIVEKILDAVNEDVPKGERREAE